MVRNLSPLASICLVTMVACDDGRTSRPHLVNPLAPSASTPAPAPAPPPPAPAPPPAFAPPPPLPREFPPFDITSIAVGDVISRTNGEAPECLGEPSWPCLYFRVVAPGTGTLEVALSYAWGTQGNQGVDVTLREAGKSGELWAQSYSPTGPRWHTTLTAPVIAGRTYDITLWYTFPNLEYELRTSLRQ
jgi:hypothetical protein